ncbi:MAG: alpha/beta hydrolase [Planctomycetota bacterium]|nr:alpha/beta hydrolase [Planctomycetota bacterium]
MSSTEEQTYQARYRWLPVWNVAWRTVRCLLIAYVAIVILLLVFERRLVYPQESWDPKIGFGDDRSLEEVAITAPDGVKLHALYHQQTSPRVVILYLHGNGGNIGHRAGLLHFLSTKYQASVLGLSYRGYGKSEGHPTEDGLYLDAQAALDYLLSREQVGVNRVLIISRSLGAAVGLKIAIDNSIPAICIESTFTSLPDVAASQYPWIPVRLLMRNRYPSLTRIPKYHGRLLQSHGDADELIPPSMAQQLYAAARCDKEFCLIPGGTHNSPQNDRYYTLLEQLISQCYDQPPEDARPSQDAP